MREHNGKIYVEEKPHDFSELKEIEYLRKQDEYKS